MGKKALLCVLFAGSVVTAQEYPQSYGALSDLVAVAESSPGKQKEDEDQKTIYGITRDYRTQYYNWQTAQMQTYGDAGLTDRVYKALSRDPSLWRVARHIQVTSSGGTVTLMGVVGSDSIRTKIEATARATNGVYDVDNQITVERFMDTKRRQSFQEK